jgi:hypothetical protein
MTYLNMSRTIAVINMIVGYSILVGCSNEGSRKQTAREETKSPQNTVVQIPDSVKVLTEGNIKIISVDTTKFQVPVEVNVTAENIYDGIFELKTDSLIKRRVLILKNLAFLTTFEDLGMGIRSNLYVFDLARKSLIRDSSFDRAYLHSSAGVFVIDANEGKIFTIGKPAWYDSKKEIITAGSFYSIKGNFFYFEKNVYKVGELGIDILADSSILSFYKNAVSGNGVYPLADDWSNVAQ